MRDTTFALNWVRMRKSENHSNSENTGKTRQFTANHVKSWQSTENNGYHGPIANFTALAQKHQNSRHRDTAKKECTWFRLYRSGHENISCTAIYYTIFPAGDQRIWYLSIVKRRSPSALQKNKKSLLKEKMRRFNYNLRTTYPWWSSFSFIAWFCLSRSVWAAVLAISCSCRSCT